MSDQVIRELIRQMNQLSKRVRILESRPIGIGEAPSNDLIYARKNKAWLQILGSTNVVDIIEANVSVKDSAGSTNTITFAHTIDAGTNKLLIVSVAHNGDATSPSTITSVTWNGTNLVLLRKNCNPAEGNIGRIDIWYLVDPEEGTYNVMVNANGNTQLCALAADFVYVNQTNPFKDIGSNNYANNTSPTGQATGDTRDLIFGALAHWNNSAQAVIQAPATDQGQATSDGAWRGCIGTSPSVDLLTPVDIDWTTSVNIVDWAVAVVAIAAEL